MTYGPIMAAGPHKGFGAYIHWPYCARICPYCDFNVYKAKGREPQPLLDAMLEDLRWHKSLLPDHPPLDSVYFGGGTPSLLSASQLDQLLSSCQALFGLRSNAEVTLEANPNDIERAPIADWQAVGINRLSIGVQSLQDDALSFLGRDHSAAQARSALEKAAAVFDNLSADMIYARPGQQIKDWETELTELLSFGIKHISLYELTISPNTAFGKAEARGQLSAMPEDDQAQIYERTEDIMTDAGLPAYEVSNYARSSEFFGRHNQIYWASGDWIGIGPGAHGRVTTSIGRFATHALKRPRDYTGSAMNGASRFETQDKLSAEAIATEALSMGLRPVSGVERPPIEDLLGRKLNEEQLDLMISDGYMTETANKLALTASGRLLADHITNLILSTS